MSYVEERPSFPVDVDPAQLVRWVMAEHEAAPSWLRTSASRATQVRAIQARSRYHLGDEEREDLTEVATVATLEIAPGHHHDGWLLTVTVEDEIGPRASSTAAAEQQLDIGTFYNEFIRPGRGIASVAAQVDNTAARENLARLLEAVERNRHPAEDTHARKRGEQ